MASKKDPVMAQHEAAMAALRKIPGVVRVGFGLKETQGQAVPEWAYRVYVRRKRPLAELAPNQRIPPEYGGFKTDVLVGAPDDIVQDTKTPDVAPGNKITRYIPNTFQSGGTVCLLVRKGTDRFLLTNDHVLADDAEVTEFSKDIYSPERKTIAGLECNNPAARIIEGRGVEANVTFEGRSYFVDATLATIINGVEGANVIEDIGPLDQGLRDLAAVTLDGSAPATVVRVAKKGATTGLTRGTVTELFFGGEGPDDPDSIWQFKITADATAGYEYEEEFELAPDEDPATLAGQFAGEPVSATVDTSGGRTILRLSGRVFSLPGDSGSCVVDEARRVVGLFHGSVIARAHIIKDGRPTYEFLPKGRGVASFIRPVFSEMELDESSGIIPPGSPSAGVGLRLAGEPVWRAPETPALEDLERALERSAAGRGLLALANRHGRELAYLVHHRRRVTVTWHRSRLPAFVAAFASALRRPDGRLPAEIDGITLAEALGRMRDVLLVEGDEALKAGIRRHQEAVLGLAGQASSINELMEALNRMDEQCFRS